MGEWISTINGLITLITALIGLIGTGVGAFFAVKNFIKAAKEKSFNELKTMVFSMADAAMKEYEHSTLKGADKKKAVIESVKASCKAAGVDLDLFLDQLDSYIDSCIDWYNGMKK